MDRYIGNIITIILYYCGHIKTIIDGSVFFHIIIVFVKDHDFDYI